MRAPNWSVAECVSYGFLDWFPEGAEETRTAMRGLRPICNRCVIKEECLEYVLQLERFAPRAGVWGGTTPRERGSLYPSPGPGRRY